MAFNYGGRIGVSTIISLTRHICRIYTTYSSRIIAWVDGSTLSSGDKTTVKDWLAAAQSACAILESVMVVYEG